MEALARGTRFLAALRRGDLEDGTTITGAWEAPPTGEWR